VPCGTGWSFEGSSFGRTRVDQVVNVALFRPRPKLWISFCWIAATELRLVQTCKPKSAERILGGGSERIKKAGGEMKRDLLQQKQLF
jgi:hypothetical protein